MRLELYKIVNTDNLGGDYPDEFFVGTPATSKEICAKLADILNEMFSSNSASRYYKVVPYDYTLVGGFEP